MSKLLVAVKSCNQHLDLGYHQKIRETWGKDAKALGIETRFFLGGGMGKNESDEVRLDCPDDYHSLPWKTKAICMWATGKVFDNLFLCDTDTFIVPSKLLACGFEAYDYVGKIDRPFGETFPYIAIDREGQKTSYPDCFPYASGGYGYFLSRKAFTIIADIQPMGWAEDLHVGNALGVLYNTGEITMLNTWAGQYSWHFPSHIYNSGYDLKFGWLDKMYGEHNGSN